VFDVIPAGEFQPAGISPGSIVNDFDLWRNISRPSSSSTSMVSRHSSASSSIPTPKVSSLQASTAAEGKREGGATGIPFDVENVYRFLAAEPMASPGQACLALAWSHRRVLLGRMTVGDDRTKTWRREAMRDS
jgi:hypothetical protein